MGNIFSRRDDPWRLSWSWKPPPDNPLPEGVTRHFVPTAAGPLELLKGTADPSDRSKHPDKAPLLLQHGAVGCGEVYLGTAPSPSRSLHARRAPLTRGADFISYFSGLGYDCYALSIRGHGHSHRPPWWRMCYLTSAEDLAADLAAGVKHVKEMHGREPLLLGHSNGGGLSQLMLDREMARVAGLVLMASAPNFGG